MRKFLFFLTVPLAMLAACSDDDDDNGGGKALQSPVLEVTATTGNSIALSWEAVEHAASYAWQVNEEEVRNTTETRLSLTGLKGNTLYKIRVKAVSGSAAYSDSKWASVEQTTSEGASAYTVYPMDPIIVGQTVPLLVSYVRNISSAGSYAVGYDDLIGPGTSFVWEKATGAFTVLDPGEFEACLAYDVNESGVIVGAVKKDDGVELPAYLDYKNNGTWTLLPTNGISSGLYWSFAASITDEGIIGGQVATTLKDGNVRAVPCYWKNYQLDQSAFDLSFDGEKTMYGCFIYSMSEDGRILTGYQDWKTGTRSPSVWVDGKLTRILGDESIPAEGGFFDGVTYSVSPNGRYACGYWSETGGAEDSQGFVYDVTTGTTTMLEPGHGGTVVTDEGKVFCAGTNGIGGYIWENGQETDLWSMFRNLKGSFATTLSPEVGSEGMLETCYALSADGSVMGGSYGYVYMDTTFQYPTLVVLE